MISDQRGLVYVYLFSESVMNMPIGAVSARTLNGSKGNKRAGLDHCLLVSSSPHNCRYRRRATFVSSAGFA